MADEARTVLDDLRQQNEALREENARLQAVISTVHDSLREPEEIIRAIREGEIDALVVSAQGQEEIYAVQRYASVYRQLVEESLPYGVWLADEHGKLIHVSRQFLEWVQTDLEQMQAKGQFHFLPEEEQRVFAERWQHCLATSQPCDFEYTIHRTDGAKRIIWTHGIRTSSHDGTPCWAGINLDVTEHKFVREELRRKAKQLEEVDRRKDEFLALLGHELRNPLAVIHHGLHLLETKASDPATLPKALRPMLNQLNHLRRLVDDLLDVSRISRGTIELRKQHVELGTVVHNAIASVRTLLESEQKRIVLSLPQVPVFLEADPVRIEQVFANLLSNAIKFTHATGLIEITATPQNGSVEVQVKDDGIGIAPEALATVFDMFVRSDLALDRSRGGLGIGLSLVRNLVEMHGGDVTAHSEGAGKGSEFVLRLPISASQAEQSPPPREEPASTVRKDRVRVLMAEDSMELAEVLGMVLESWGYEVIATHDGPSTVEASRVHAPDVVLLDVGLPGLDGYEVARRVRAHQGPQPLLVAVTGYGQQMDRARSSAAGFDYHLVKPADMAELQQILARVGGMNTNRQPRA
jgi:PAS domain S-box-containing protein